MSDTVFQILQKTLWATVGTAAFTMIFKIRFKNLVIAALGGFLACFTWLMLENFVVDSPFTTNMVAALIATGYSAIMARITKTPATVYLTPSILPLVPGGSIYSTMSCLVSGDHAGFLLYGSRTLQVGLGIAAGIIISSIIESFFRPLRPTFKKMRDDLRKRTVDE